MTCVRRSAAVVALAAGCSFTPPAGTAIDPGADAAIDAPEPLPDSEPRPWLEPWARRKAITLLASQIEAPGDGALADFPVLVSVTDPQIAAAALASGEDLVFTAGDGETVLASELEAFTPATGELAAWVRVPSLSSTTDTRLYVYYGNPTPPAQTPEDAWGPEYLAVWHLQQDPGPGGAGDIRDATSRDHDGTADAQMEPGDSVPAQIGRGLQFDGASDVLSFGSMDLGDAFTISMWIRFGGGNSVKTLIANSEHGLQENGFRFFVNSANTSDRRLVFETGSGFPTSGRGAWTDPGAIALDAWTHVAAVVDRDASTARLYVNGERAEVNSSTASSFRTSSDLRIARMKNVFLHFPGTLDEIQVSTTLRSPEWLQTSFHNQGQPGSFHALGPEELAPPL